MDGCVNYLNLFVQIHVKQNECGHQVETAYYSSKNFPPVCYICGKEGNLETLDQELPVHQGCVPQKTNLKRKATN